MKQISKVPNSSNRYEFLNIKTGVKGMFTLLQAKAFGWL